MRTFGIRGGARGLRYIGRCGMAAHSRCREKTPEHLINIATPRDELESVGAEVGRLEIQLVYPLEQ